MGLYEPPKLYNLRTNLIFWLFIFVEILIMPDVTGTNLWKTGFLDNISKIIVFLNQKRNIDICQDRNFWRPKMENVYEYDLIWYNATWKSYCRITPQTTCLKMQPLYFEHIAKFGIYLPWANIDNEPVNLSLVSWQIYRFIQVILQFD